MNKMSWKIFTSESVGAGHPDKICDQIADAILDEILKQDPDARIACEVMASNRLIIIGGEITTSGYVDVVKFAWKILKKLEYTENDFTIISNVNAQSTELNLKLNAKNKVIGAGDQGMMIGYAVNETPELMPLPIAIANALTERAEHLRRNNKFKWAKADLKSQVTIDYSLSKPRIQTVVMSIQHDPNYDKNIFENFVKTQIMDYVAQKYNLNIDFKIFINPLGSFTQGGPMSDTGLTGRKIIVDTYGGRARHGGGAFSGKDYTKTDRTGAYFARWVAKNIVAANLATEIEIQISYTIGQTYLTSLAIETFGTEKIPISKIRQAILKTFDFSPIKIIEILDLKKPIYSQVSCFGHFGRPRLNLPWERTNRIESLKQALK